LTSKKITEREEFILGDFIRWMNCIQRPQSICEQILDSKLSEQKKIGKALRVWAVGFTLTMAVQIPLHYSLGIELDGKFQLASFVLLLFQMVVFVAVLQLGFRMCKIQSKFSDILIMYSIMVGSFMPLLAFIGYPAAFKLLTEISHLKGLELPFEQVIVKAIQGIFESKESSLLDIFSASISSVSLLVNGIILLSFIRLVALKTQVDKFRVVTAFNLSLIVLFPLPAVILSVPYYLLLFSFVK
jgi:hypothetical protein